MKSIPSFQNGIQIRHFAWQNKRVASAYQDNFLCSSSSHAKKSSSFFYPHLWQKNLDTHVDHRNNKNSREKSIIHNCDLNSGVCYILIFTFRRLSWTNPFTYISMIEWGKGGGEIPSKSLPRDESERHNTHKTHTHTHTHNFECLKFREAQKLSLLRDLWNCVFTCLEWWVRK